MKFLLILASLPDHLKLTGFGIKIIDIEVGAHIFAVIMNGKVVYDGPAMLVWPRGVFHQIESLEAGSSAINFAVLDDPVCGYLKAFDLAVFFYVDEMSTSLTPCRTTRLSSWWGCMYQGRVTYPSVPVI